DQRTVTMLDPDKPAHATAAGRLRDELIIWLTTVTESGQPKPTPVWFLWDGQEFLIYSLKDGRKTGYIAANPHVSLHLDGHRRGRGERALRGTGPGRPGRPARRRRPRVRRQVPPDHRLLRVDARQLRRRLPPPDPGLPHAHQDLVTPDNRFRERRRSCAPTG